MKNTKLIRVVAALVDTRNLILYTEDGNTVVIPQGDPRLAKILDIVTPICAAGGVAEVVINPIDTYSQFEESTGGLVKLFRVARSKLFNFFKATDKTTSSVPPQIIGDVVAQLRKATVEIMQHAVPISECSLGDTDLYNGPTHQEGDSGDTLIAVTGTNVLPDVHKLKAQMGRAVAEGSGTGLALFIARASTCNRQHTQEDLMRFMERGDLPIANDGSIIIYKVLKRTQNGTFTYVDCHSKQVPQKVGTLVHMAPNLVDHNRAQECSNGLHVARRGYLSSFSGDVCVIAKVNPEDVIAVPYHDANKMRVCAYHILYELSAEDYAELCKNKPLKTNQGKQMLANAISGDHVGILSDVEIGGHCGKNLTIKDSDAPEQEAIAIKLANPTEATPMAEPLKEVGELQSPAVDPKKAAAAAAAVQAPTVLSRSDQARVLYTRFKKATKEEKAEAAQHVLAFKKAKKVSWEVLGITDAEVEKLMK